MQLQYVYMLVVTRDDLKSTLAPRKLVLLNEAEVGIVTSVSPDKQTIDVTMFLDSAGRTQATPATPRFPVLFLREMRFVCVCVADCRTVPAADVEVVDIAYGGSSARIKYDPDAGATELETGKINLEGAGGRWPEHIKKLVSAKAIATITCFLRKVSDSCLRLLRWTRRRYIRATSWTGGTTGLEAS